MKRQMMLRKMAYVGIFAALIAVMSQISIPLPSGVPVTMQVFAVALAGMMLGPAAGAVTVLVYVAMGAVGMPVFAGFFSGAQVLVGPTGGFLYGFVPMAVLCGLGARRGRWTSILCGLGAFAALHGCGIVHFALVMDTSLGGAAMLTTVPFIAKDLGSILLAAVVSKRLGALRLGINRA